MKAELVKRYEASIEGVLGCFDRVVVTGTLTAVAHPDAMTAVLKRDNIRCFDIGQFAEPLRVAIRDNALKAAQEAGVEVEYLSKSRGFAKRNSSPRCWPSEARIRVWCMCSR